MAASGATKTGDQRPGTPVAALALAAEGGQPARQRQTETRRRQIDETLAHDGADQEEQIRHHPRK